MKEKSSIILLVLIFLVLGIVSSYLVLFYSSFNFSDSELIINNNIVTEKLTYNTDKDYHTLYRNFETPISGYNPYSDYISISGVNCSSGSAYARSNTGIMQFLQKSVNSSYTLMKYGKKFDYEILNDILKRNFKEEYEKAEENLEK